MENKILNYNTEFTKIERSEDLSDVLDGVYHVLMNTLVRFKIKNCDEHAKILDLCQEISDLAGETVVQLPSRFAFLEEVSSLLEEMKND